MNIITKFDLGQKVYRIEQIMSNEKINCVACGGLGWITLADKKDYTCPNCDGEGTLDEKKTIMFKICNPSSISSIYTNSCFKANREITIDAEYILYNCAGVFRESELFETKEEAQVECKKREDKI